MTKNKKLKKVKKVKKFKKIKKVIEKSPKTKTDKKAQIQPSKSVNKNTYTPEDKVQIVKIKKQATEKRLYEVKNFVVYPKHGVGKIIAVEKATVGQIEIQFYKIYIEKEKSRGKRFRIQSSVLSHLANPVYYRLHYCGNECL